MEEIDDLNNKLVELYGKLIKIKYKLDTLDKNNVKTKPINQVNSTESVEQRHVQASERTNK